MTLSPEDREREADDDSPCWASERIAALKASDWKRINDPRKPMMTNEDRERLEKLTTTALRDIGAWCAYLGERDPVFQRAENFKDLAALCEAVASSYVTIRAEAVGGHDLCIGGVGDRGVCTYWLSDEGDTRFEWRQHETLAAALGAVSASGEKAH